MLKLPRSNLVTLAIYRTGAITAEFFDEFTSMLELLVVYSCPVLITGDVNIHLDDPNDVNTIKFNGILESFGLIQSVIGPTHSLGRTLDVVITRNDLPKPIINIGLPGEISDHSLLVLQLQLPRPPVNFVNVSTRAWKSFDEHSFRSELRSSKLCNPEEYGGASVDDLQELYDTTLRTLLDKHAPSRSARRRFQPTTPWFDAECAAAKRKTRALERRYRRTRLVDDRTAWTTQAQKKHQLYGRKQSEFWERKITDSRGDPKKLWRNLKSVLRQKKEKPPSSEELTAEAFSNAFAEKLAGVRSSTASAAPPAFDNPPCISSFVRFETIDPSMILRLIRNAAGKSCELDPVPSWVIQKFADELSPFVAALFNASMSSGSFPSSQKTAAITPVLKKATLDPYDLGNYRPISNLTFLSKLLERAAYEQIVSYFDRYQLLPELQSAYRKHRSTETATIKVMSDVYEAADAGSITLLGLLDLSAAFDTVDHRILLDRLGHDYGIGGLAIQWIESYLTGRSQFVRFNGVTSRTVPVTSGVPQGSVLGPILFISYSAAVIAIVQHHGFKVHAFADDLQIYGSTAQSGAADLMARMSNCVESVASWMSSNRLRLNPSKTELIWLGTSRRLQHCAGLTMSVCGADVRPVECVRDLGVLIDSNMTLLNHVNNVAGICFYQLRQLRIIRRSLTTEAAHSLVRALIHTRVDYCNGLLAAGPKYLHEKLQCVLRAAARLVLQLPHRASVSDIMRRQLHWLEMPDRIRFKLCTLVFRCLHGLAPRYLSDLCTPATVHTHLRSSVTLERSLLVPRTKTKTIGPRGFYFASSAAWNALPVHLRDPGLSLNNFKIKLKTHFFS